MIDFNDYIDAMIEFNKRANEQSSRPFHLRAGQFLCAKFSITDPDVFYEENEQIAMDKFYIRYVKVQDNE